MAAIASVIETYRRLGLNLRDYLAHALPKPPEWPINGVEELTPIH